MAELEAVLNDPAIKAEAADALRALISQVVLTPDVDAPDGLRAELFGDLAEILSLAGSADAGGRGHEKPRGTGVPRAGLASQLSVVAGARNHLYRTQFVALSRR